MEELTIFFKLPSNGWWNGKKILFFVSEKYLEGLSFSAEERPQMDELIEFYLYALVIRTL